MADNLNLSLDDLLSGLGISVPESDSHIAEEGASRVKKGVPSKKPDKEEGTEPSLAKGVEENAGKKASEKEADEDGAAPSRSATEKAALWNALDFGILGYGPKELSKLEEDLEDGFLGVSDMREERPAPDNLKSASAQVAGEPVEPNRPISTREETRRTRPDAPAVSYPGSIAVSGAGEAQASDARFRKAIIALVAVLAVIVVSISLTAILGDDSGNSDEAVSSFATSEREEGSIAPARIYSYRIEGPDGQYLVVKETPSVDSDGTVSQATMNVEVVEGQQAQVLGFLESQFSDRVIESAMGNEAVIVEVDASDLHLSVADYESLLAQSTVDFQKL